MVVTGAGPGIMAAGAEGAGPERAIGISIRLPFEEAPSDVLADGDAGRGHEVLLHPQADADQGVVGVRVACPGGFGTQDETFELFTLLQTGKASPAPVVLLDVPGGTYWTRWVELRRGRARGRRPRVEPEDHELYLVTDDVDVAVAEIERFWRNYHSIRWVGDRLVVRLRHAPTDDEVAELDERLRATCSSTATSRPPTRCPPRWPTRTTSSCPAS